MRKRRWLLMGLLVLAGAAQAEFRLFADETAEHSASRPAEIAGERVHFADAPVLGHRQRAWEFLR